MEYSDILLVTPPFTQLNTPYPATVFLKGFLNQHGYIASQVDLSIETLLAVFSRKGLTKIFNIVEASQIKLSPNTRRILKLKDDYIASIEPVMAFLQGKDSSLAYSISAGSLPVGPRFDTAHEDMEWLFGSIGVVDKAKYLATLFIEDIGDFISENVDPYFGFSRYAEQLALSEISFSKIRESLNNNSPVTDAMCALMSDALLKYNPKTVGITVPFPGNLYTALKLAQYIKQIDPDITIVMGGGYVNTELRQLSELELFDFVDYVCLDDGERPLLQLLNHLNGKCSREELVRTFFRDGETIKYIDNKTHVDFEHADIGTPDYSDLNLGSYISTLEMANPMHRLWSDGRWNKLMLAHGCYWHKCSFCDVTLDYIKRYSKADASVICDRIEAVVKQTGSTGFHFVDEAAPPTLLRDMAIELLRRKLRITWWTNVRFEQTFSPDLCVLLAESGCIAVSGGLEVASERLLAKMNKGVSIEQVAAVASNLEKAGIMVHAYLMYGFPTETAQETIDALEVVRQLFLNGLVQSAFWHRFVMTAHSLVGVNPEEYGVVRLEKAADSFAKNDCIHEDPKGCNHSKFSYGLKKALFNYMHAACLDMELQEWFDIKVPRTTVHPNLIAKAIRNAGKNKINDNQRVVWICQLPDSVNIRKGLIKLFFANKNESYNFEVPEAEAMWVVSILPQLSVRSNKVLKLSDIAQSYEAEVKSDFNKFKTTQCWTLLRENGLLIL